MASQIFGIKHMGLLRQIHLVYGFMLFKIQSKYWSTLVYTPGTPDEENELVQKSRLKEW